MSRPATPTLPARLATGDWAVLQHADQGPLGFLGKVTDGEWDPRDDALLRARVDTTRSKPLWFAAGDLRRVEPSEEADLVELALERGLVPPDRAERLRADVAAVRERTLTFVRSPGLLDRLWAALPTDVSLRTGGLAAFFDEGRRALFETRERHHRLVPPRGADTPAPEPAPTSSTVDRVQTHEEAVVRILESLAFEELWEVRTQLIGPAVEGQDGPMRTEVLQGLLTAAPSLPALLEALPAGVLERLLPLLGYPRLRAGRDLTLAQHLCQVLRGPPGWTATPANPAPAPAPAEDWSLRVRTREEAVARILDVLPFEELWTVRTRLLGDGPVETSEGVSVRTTVLQGLLTAAPSLPALLQALPEGTLERILPLLGYAHLRSGTSRRLPLADHLLSVLCWPHVSAPATPQASRSADTLATRNARAEAFRLLLLTVTPAARKSVIVGLGGSPDLARSSSLDEHVAALLATRVTPDELLAALPDPVTPQAPAPTVARTLDEAETVTRLIGLLPVEALRAVRARLQAARPELGSVEASRDALARALVLARPALPELLEALPQSAFTSLVQTLGPVRFEGSAEAVVAELLEGLRRLDPSAPAPQAPSGTSTPPEVPAPPRPPTSLADATTRILGVVRGPQLPGLCDRLGAARPTWSDPGEARANIVAAGRPIQRLVEALPAGTSRHLPFVLGLPKLEGTEPELAAAVIERLERLLSAADHLRLLLGVVPEATLPTLVRDLGAPPPASTALEDQLAALLAADITPCDVLAALQPRELQRAIERFGVEGAADPQAALRSLLTTTPGPPPPPRVVDRWPGEARAVWRLLALVRRRELLGLCERLGKPFQDNPAATCRLLASSAGMAELPAALPPDAAALAPRVLAPVQAAPDATPEHLLTRILRPMELGRRANLVATLGSEAHSVSAASDLARQLLAGGHGLREVLDTLDDAQLVTAAAACGVPADGESPRWLHAAILLLESPPETS